jgi:hypothetical protein
MKTKTIVFIDLKNIPACLFVKLTVRWHDFQE